MQPARYRLPARLSDMIHGWLDGRRGIPPLPESLGRPVNGSAVRTAESHLNPLLDLPAQTGPEHRPPWLRTPRIEVLSREALERIEGEKIGFGDEWAVLKRESGRFLKARDAVVDEAAIAGDKLEQARVPLPDHQLGRRRFAERDSQKRPDELVRARRQAAWQRRLDAAEQQHQSAITTLAHATREAELREQLIRDRAAVARAAGRRHYELAHRRIATYLQQLIRTHKHGTELNLLLLEHPVGPDLPSWTREPDAGQSGIEQMFAEGSAPMTGDPYLSDEMSGS